MSFKIQQSHKFASQFATPKESKGSKSDILSKDDYLLFDIDKDSSGNVRKSQTAVKAHKGGNYIRTCASAQADFY